MTTGRQLTQLVNTLAGTDEAAAHRAISELMAAFPMLALPERWTDKREYQPPGQSTVPQWLITAGEDWNASNPLLNLCADQAEHLQGPQRDIFFTRMAALLGASRLFTAILRERGRTGLATDFILRLTHTRMRQFPRQICFSPTLRCNLECPYCISAGTANEAAPEPEQNRADELLDWLNRQGIQRMGLSGGEPTLSPLFPYLLEKTGKRNMSLYMASNGMFSERTCNLIIARKIGSVTLHLTTETMGDEGKIKIFSRNAKALVRAGVNVALRCNLTGPEIDPALFAGHAHATGIREIRVAVPTPNAQQANEYIEPATLRDFAGLLVRLHERCDACSIPLHLAKPFPLCLLPEQTARAFLGNGSAAINCPMNQNDYSNNIVVHPDFSFIPCLGLSLKQGRPVTEHTNLREAAQTFADQVEPLIKKPLFQHCPECPLWLGSRCIGACLSYRLFPEPVTAHSKESL